YERLTRLMIREHEHLRPALGSHNLRSLAHGIAAARHVGLPLNGLELQMLHGMGDDEKEVLVNRGHRVRVYMPYGKLIPGMAYLVRRLLENTSNDSFLRASFTDHVSPEILLMNPQNVETPGSPESRSPSSSSSDDATDAAFANEPWIDFAVEDNRDAMRAALKSVAGKLGEFYPASINGVSVETESRGDSVNPSRPDQVVGVASLTGAEHANQAVAAAKAALPDWRRRDVKERADFLRQAAAAMRDQRWELAAWEVFEAGKTWREADADVAEAIDFCEYYAQAAEAIWNRGGVDAPGEENRFVYVPRGVAAVIAPWNFPLAILTGMTSAALVTGNTVVMKPAKQTPVVGAQLMRIFQEVGLPNGVLNFLPGDGKLVGAALVEHPDVNLIAFTGSRQVGLSVNAKAAE
ncbi:MAG: bifunctional proline dehydrogenase/L-glutamate gamma-semialdehyde dehydrogenase, partial [Planctomycetales bacterium]